MKELNKYDLHIHTHYSKCSNLKPQKLLKIAKKMGFTGIAVTDHYTIKGGIKTSRLNKDKDFEVIVGTEIETPLGSILGYYLNKEIKSRIIPEIIEEIHSQGGIAAVAHPFRSSPRKAHKFRLEAKEIKGKIDAVEAFNARNFPWNNPPANNLAEKLDVAKLAGSDTHFSFEFGKTFTSFNKNLNLRKAIKTKKTKANGKITWGLFGGFFSFVKNRLPIEPEKEL